MEMAVMTKIKGRGGWKEAVLSDDGGGRTGVILKTMFEGKEVEIDADDIEMIMVPNCEGLSKGEYTETIVIIQKAMQAGFKVTW